MTRYGQEACEKLITGLAGYPISIVSGLALGTDTCAHKAALAAGLHTLVVPGSGLNDDVLYPKSNRGFAKEILKAGGGFLSNTRLMRLRTFTSSPNATALWSDFLTQCSS